MDGIFLGRKDILNILRNVDLLGEDCWLTSGAALVLYGVKEETRDIDLVCTSQLADRLEAQGVPFRRSPLGNTRIFAYSGQIEVLEDWETEEVVQLEGLPAASLMSIRKQKEALGREKDQADIRLIDSFLSREKLGK